MKVKVSSVVTLLFLLLSSIQLVAQDIVIFVTDMDQVPLIGANVALINPADSIQIQTTTDLNGKALMTRLANDSVLVTISYIGFSDLDTLLVLESEQSLYSFQLKEDAKTLEEVIVTARRPLLRQDGDKTIVDPTPLLDISTNVLEILEVTPGMFVDPEGAIYLGSTSPAVLYINGREQRMGAQDIANLLRSLPPGSIDRIELIRSPSSRYDAASSGGIVNIILKKGMKIGRFGSVNAGMNQGKLGNRFAGFSLYNTSDKSSWYVNANYNKNAVLNDMSSLRESSAPFTLHQSAMTRQLSDNGFLGLGMSYEINDRTTFSYDGRISKNFGTSNTESENTLISDPEVVISSIQNQVNNRNPSYNQQHDFGTILRLDTIGSEIDFKLGYSHSTNSTEQDYLTAFVFPLLPDLSGEGEIDNQRHFLQFQTDLTYKLPFDINFESGVKASLLDFSNQSDFYVHENGVLQIDTGRLSGYHYREIIGAFYSQASKKIIGDITIKAGVRGEHTNMSGQQTIPSDTSFSVNRLDWFPYLFISRKVWVIAGYELRGYMIYRKTLSRPTYQNLNPAIRILDQFNYESGNPALLPQFTDNIELNLSFDEFPIFAIGQNYTSGIISNVLYTDNSNESLTYNTYDNIGATKETYFRMVVGLPPVRKYFGVIGAQYNYLEYDGIYSNDPIHFNRGSWRLFTFHSLTLTKTTKIMASGFMMLNGQMNLIELGNIGQVNINLNQSFFNKKLNISVFARDVFRTMKTQFLLQQSDIVFEGERYADNQRFGVSMRYNFGIRNKTEKRNMLNFEMEE